MNQASKVFHYCSALRMKEGELEGVRQLTSDVAAHFLPRFIVPPSGERDQATPLLLDAKKTPDISSALAKHWRDRAALVDASYILNEYGRDHMHEWLPQMFERARENYVRAIPVALLSDIGIAEAKAFRTAIARNEQIKFAICVPSGEMVGAEFFVKMKEALHHLGLAPSDCAVLADFSGSEFANPEIVAPIITGALELLQDFGQWKQIIFQGTHYPDKNPATHGMREIWPRNEWHAWCRAVKFDPTTAENMTFGDYAADCAKMQFGNNRAAAIRHLRYTAGPNWLIQRGAKSGTDAQIMRTVCQEIVTSGHFAGANFSAADAHIQRTANGTDGPGNAKTWRQINTTHHITQVITDIAKVRGLVIAKRAADTANAQLSLPV